MPVFAFCMHVLVRSSAAVTMRSAAVLSEIGLKSSLSLGNKAVSVAWRNLTYTVKYASAFSLRMPVGD